MKLRTVFRKEETGWRAFLKSPSFVMLVVSLAVLSFCIVWIGHLRPFNSDDLYWQETIRTWRPFSGNLFYFGTKDIFVGLAPFFWVMEHVFEPSRRLVIVETVMLTATSFAMCYFAVLYFMRKLKIEATYLTLLPWVWLASFGYPIVQNYLNTDWRTFQIGYSFVTFALVAAYLNRDIHPLRTTWGKVLTGVGIVWTGLLMYGDPYYTIFTAGPLVLFVGGLYAAKKIKRNELGTVYVGIALSYVASKVIAWACTKAGLHIIGETPSVFVGFEQIVSNTLASLHGMFIIFGADFLGHKTSAAGTYGFLLNAILLAFILLVIFGYRKLVRPGQTAQASLPQLWGGFFAGVMVFIFLVYTSSTLAADANNYRFYIMFAYCAATLLAIRLGLMKSDRGRMALAVLLLAATLFNLAFMVKNTKVTPGDIAANKGNMWNYAIIHEVEKRGETKGYGSYWHGSINTYLSDNKVTFLPSLCAPDGITSQFRWLIDGGQFDRKASKSFYVLDPYFPAPGLCNPSQLQEQFGAPQDIVQVGNKTILFYDYDITSRMRKVQY